MSNNYEKTHDEYNMTINEDYTKRINLVLDYIECNLETSLSLDEMAKIANFSKYHFHRIFISIVGESPIQYQRRKRLESSAKELYQAKTAIKEISFKYGFSSPAVYSRDFIKHFGKSPKSLRKSLISRIENSKNYNIEVKNIKSFKFAYYRAVGFNSIVPKFIELRISLRKDKVKVGTMVEFINDNQYITEKSKCRYDIGYIITDSECDSDEYILKDTNDQKYAIHRLKGRTTRIEESYDQIYCWLLRNNYEPDDSPLMILFYKMFSLKPVLPIDFTIADVCVPVKKQYLKTK